MTYLFIPYFALFLDYIVIFINMNRSLLHVLFYKWTTIAGLLQSISLKNIKKKNNKDEQKNDKERLDISKG